MTFYLGIDGGGTKTSCAAGDEFKLLASASAGPSNVMRVGEAKARESLYACIRQACAAAGITLQQVSSVCIGAAGAARPEVANLIRQALGEFLDAPVMVVGDMEIALHAAFDTGPGVVVIAGTGSIAYGRNQHGTIARAGGWGAAISDEGSAYWIGRSAIAAILRAKDQGLESKICNTTVLTLQDAILTRWELSSLDDLVRAANSTALPEFAGLFPTVQDCAASGDEGARLVLAGAGRELARLASIVIGRLSVKNVPAGDSCDSSNPNLPIAIAGGVFRHAPLVRETFIAEVHSFYPKSTAMPQIVDPVDGALSMARRMNL